MINQLHGKMDSLIVGLNNKLTSGDFIKLLVHQLPFCYTKQYKQLSLSSNGFNLLVLY